MEDEFFYDVDECSALTSFFMWGWHDPRRVMELGAGMHEKKKHEPRRLRKKRDRCNVIKEAAYPSILFAYPSIKEAAYPRNQNNTVDSCEMRARRKNEDD